MSEAQHSPLDNVASEFATYEDFLDSQISSTDLYYLEDEELVSKVNTQSVLLAVAVVVVDTALAKNSHSDCLSPDPVSIPLHRIAG